MRRSVSYCHYSRQARLHRCHDWQHYFTPSLWVHWKTLHYTAAIPEIFQEYDTYSNPAPVFKINPRRKPALALLFDNIPLNIRSPSALTPASSMSLSPFFFPWRLSSPYPILRLSLRMSWLSRPSLRPRLSYSGAATSHAIYRFPLEKRDAGKRG